MSFNVQRINHREIGAGIIFLAIEDITKKRKRDEAIQEKLEILKKEKKEIKKAQKLELIGMLAGGIVHDFRNILTAIIGNLSLAKLYMKPEDKVLDLLTQTEKASLAAEELTQQLLTFFKHESPIKKTVNILGLLKNIPAINLRGAKTKCEFFLPDDLLPVKIDESQISQVFNNLIINAEQAMPFGGRCLWDF